MMTKRRFSAMSQVKIGLGLGGLIGLVVFNAACSRVGFKSNPEVAAVEENSECEGDSCPPVNGLLGKIKIFTTETWDKEEPQYVAGRDVLLRLEPSLAAEVWLNEAGDFHDTDGTPGLSVDSNGVIKQSHVLEGSEGVVKVWAMFRGKEVGDEVIVNDDVILDLTDPAMTFTPQGIVRVPEYTAIAKVVEANLDTVECKGPGEMSYESCADSLKGLDFSRKSLHPLDNVFTLQVRLTDKAGRKKEVTHSFQVDSHKPKVALQSPPTGKFNANTVSVRFQAVDSYDGNVGSGVEKIYCSFNGGTGFVEGAANNCEVKATPSADIYELVLKTPDAKIYNVVLKAKDKAGNESDVSAAINFEIDRSQPTLTVTAPSYYQTASTVSIPFVGAWPSGGTYTLKYECTLTAGTVVVQKDTACMAPTKVLTGLTNSEPGKEYVETIKAIFTRGSEPPYEVTKEVRFFVDLADPTATIAFAPGQLPLTNGTSANVLITAADMGSGLNPASLQCFLQKTSSAAVQVPCQLGATTLNIATLTDGAYAIYYLIKDLAGRGPVRSNTITLTIDRTGSPISISGPGVPMAGYSGVPNRVDGNVKPTFQIGVDASVNVATGVKCTIVGLFSDVACGGASFVLPANLPSSGVYELIVKVTDMAGNLSENTYIWAHDKTPPTVGLGDYATASFTGSSTTVSFSATDLMSEIQTVTCYLQRPSSTPVSIACPYTASTPGNMLSVRGEFTIANAVAGAYEFWVEATDKSNNKGISAHGVYNVTVEIKLVDKEKTLRSLDNKKIDILLILDTSGSMKDDLKVMAAKFNDFLAVLNGYDWRIGFVMNANAEGDKMVCNIKANSWVKGKIKCTAAPGHLDKAVIYSTSGAMADEKKPGFDGRLLDIDGAAGTYWITPTTPNSANLFLNTIQVHLPKITGPYVGNKNNAGEPIGLPASQHERSLFSLQRVLQRYKDSSFGGVNKDFFRANTHLAVINVSDEDETNFFQADTGELAYMDDTKYVLPCIGAVVTGKPCKIKHNTPQQTYDFVKQTFPDRNFVWNSIVEFPPDILDPNDDAGWNAHCARKATQHVNVGCYYREMAKLTGGKVVNIGVQGSYTQYLREIGEVTKQLARKVDLECAPYQGKVDLYVNASLVTIPYVIKGLTVEYQQDLPAGDYVAKYKCQLP